MWLQIGDCGCPSSSLPSLQRLPLPVWNYFSSYFLLLLEWERRWGKGGCAWQLRFISQAARRRRWPWGSDQNCKQQPRASGSEGWGQCSPHILWCLPNEEGREMVRERCSGQPLLQAVPAPQPTASHHCCRSTSCWLCHFHTLKVIKSGSKVTKSGSRALQNTFS